MVRRAVSFGGILESLELLDQVQCEGNVLVGIGAAVAGGFGTDTDGARRLDPLLGSKGKTGG